MFVFERRPGFKRKGSRKANSGKPTIGQRKNRKDRGRKKKKSEGGTARKKNLPARIGIGTAFEEFAKREKPMKVTGELNLVPLDQEKKTERTGRQI